MTSEETSNSFAALESKVREIPLLQRLPDCRQRISKMCSDGTPPRMSIPVQWNDDDFFISTTLADAIAATTELARIAAEEVTFREGHNQRLKDAWEERDKALAENGRMREALDNIAMQLTPAEMEDREPDSVEDADWEAGYLGCIQMARSSIAAFESKHPATQEVKGS